MILRKILAFIIDLLIIIFVSILFIIVVGNSLGRFSLPSIVGERNIAGFPIIAIFGTNTILYIIFSVLNKWNTVGRILMHVYKKEEIQYSFFHKSLLAFVIDFSFILLITFVVDNVLNEYIFIQFFHLLFVVIFIYHVVAGLFYGKTIGKINSGIQIIGNKQNLTLVQSLKREVVFKFGLAFLLPYIFFYAIGITKPFNIFLDIVCFGGIFILMYFIFKGKLWWNKFSETKKVFISISKSRLTINYFVTIIIFCSLLFFLRYTNNKLQDPEFKIFGFNYPLKYPEYPTNYKLKKYFDFIQHQNTSPKDYILGLFDKYDIVVLCESYHGECTQWELITDIVCDKRFVDKVGNVFTEYGSSRHQNKVDTFLNTKYNSEIELEQATASIMEYMSGGFYYFLKNVNKLNTDLPDSLKVREHFTDVLDWDYLAVYRFYEKSTMDINRDSAMAQITINWYKEKLKNGKRRKCLIVTNTRHAFGYAGGVERLKQLKTYHVTSGNQGQYIFEAFPNQTACVVQNSTNNKSNALFMPFSMPINHGIWNKVFKLNNYKPVGFDLANSPFGLDNFDFHPLLGAKSKLMYQDIFTGVIFNKPYEDEKSVDYPFKRYAIEKEYLQKFPETDTSLVYKKVQEIRGEFGSNEAQHINSKNLLKDINKVGILSLMIILLSTCLSIILLTISFISRLVKDEQK